MATKTTRGSSKRTRRKATPKTEKPTGRPRKELDGDLVEEMASQFFTTAEIAARMDCSKDTIERRTADRKAKGANLGTGSLKRRLFEIAMGDDLRAAVPALIYLTKNFAGMSNANEVHLTGANGGPIQTIDQADVDLSLLRKEDLIALRDIYARAAEATAARRDHEGTGEAQPN
jgi:hypothetical protein